MCRGGSKPLFLPAKCMEWIAGCNQSAKCTFGKPSAIMWSLKMRGSKRLRVFSSQQQIPGNLVDSSPRRARARATHCTDVFAKIGTVETFPLSFNSPPLRYIFRRCKKKVYEGLHQTPSVPVPLSQCGSHPCHTPCPCQPRDLGLRLFRLCDGASWAHGVLVWGEPG